MNKNVKGAIAGAVALILIGGVFYFGFQAAKKGDKCMHCGKYFKHGQLMGHQLTCSENKTNMNFRQKKYFCTPDQM